MSAWLMDDFEDDATWTPRTALWMRRALVAWFGNDVQPEGAPDVRDIIRVARVDAGLAVDDLVAHFAGQPERFVKWVPVGEYAGADYASGGWRLDYLAVMCELVTHVSRTQQARALAHDAERFPTLDAWLGAEAKGLLRAEPAVGGSSHLPVGTQRQLRRAAVLRRWRNRRSWRTAQ